MYLVPLSVGLQAGVECGGGGRHKSGRKVLALKKVILGEGHIIFNR